MVFVQSNAPFTWFLIGTVQVQSDFDTILDVNKSVKRKASQAGRGAMVLRLCAATLWQHSGGAFD